MGHAASVADDIQPFMSRLQMFVDRHFHIVEFHFHSIQQRIVIGRPRRDLVKGIDHLDNTVQNALRQHQTQIPRRGRQRWLHQSFLDPLLIAAPSAHQIAETLDIDFDTAEKLKLAIRNPAKVTNDMREKMLLAIRRNLAVWLSGVEITLEEFNLSDMLPNKILLCGGGAGLAELQDVLSTTDWFKGLPFARRPIIHLVESSDIPGIHNETTASLDHSYITALGLLRVAMDTLAGSPDEGGIRSKLAKLLQN